MVVFEITSHIQLSVSEVVCTQQDRQTDGEIDDFINPYGEINFPHVKPKIYSMQHKRRIEECKEAVKCNMQ